MVKPKAEERPMLAAVRRTSVGTSSAKHLRARGLVPGVVYGKKTEAMAIAVDGRGLIKVLHTEAGEHALLTLRVEEDGAEKASTAKKAGKPWERPVLVKTVEHHPVDGHVVHIDFHAIVLTERIRVSVSVELKGEPVGVKEQDGILEHFLREVEVECLPTEIPKHIELEVSELKIGDTVHVRDLPTPPGTTITSDPEGVVASVQAKKEEKAEEEAPAAEEPEVISEKKEEAAEGEGEAAAEGKAEGKAKPEGKREEKKEKKE